MLQLSAGLTTRVDLLYLSKADRETTVHLPWKNMQVFEQKVSRRNFLKTSLLTIGGCMFPCTAFGAIGRAASPERMLSLHNLHTGESLRTLYWNQGKYIHDALADINYILRDHRTGEIESIDKRLLDLLYIRLSVVFYKCNSS